MNNDKIRIPFYLHFSSSKFVNIPLESPFRLTHGNLLEITYYDLEEGLGECRERVKTHLRMGTGQNYIKRKSSIKGHHQTIGYFVNMETANFIKGFNSSIRGKGELPIDKKIYL